MSTNPRYANGNLRRKNRARLKAMQCECAICHGRLGPIHYDEPSDAAHPLSFVVDEKVPVARWKQFGYASARQCAEDFSNLQAAHYVCNLMKSDKLNFELTEAHLKKADKTIARSGKSAIDGKW